MFLHGTSPTVHRRQAKVSRKRKPQIKHKMVEMELKNERVQKEINRM